MSKELVIASDRHETKVAILEDDQLVEIYFQRAQEYSLAGSIHKGRVTRVLPGMQSAFVDLGLERDTFLYVSDFFEENEEFDRISTDDRPKRSGRERGDRERSDRDRGEREVPVQTAAAPIAPALTEPEAGMAAPASVERTAEEAPAAAAPVVSQGEARGERSGAGDRDRGGDRGGDRDRRGRRSRRRRGRGRGFPDSKYAAPSAEADTPEAAEPAEVDAEAASGESEEEIFLLPGESLAKYRRPAGEESRDDEESEPAQDDEPVAEAEAVVSAEEAVVEAAAEEPEEAAAEVEPEPAAEVAVAEPAAEIELPAEPEVEAEVAGEVEDAAPAPVEEDELEAAEVSVQGETSVIASSEGSIETSPNEDRELLMEELAGEMPEFAEENEQAEEEASAAEAEGGQEPGEAAEHQPSEQAAAGEDLESRSVSIRDPGMRFTHRVAGRRMRRRGRSGRSGEAEPGLTVPGERPPAGPEVRSSRDRDRGERGDRGDRPDRGERGERESRPERSDRGDRGDRVPQPSISELLKEGQEIIVQIAKEPLGQKGARITSHIALPGRYVVYMPTLEHLGVSRKIASDEERARLKKVLQAARTGMTGGFIVRTAGEGHTEEEITADMSFLYNLWLDIRAKAEKRPAPVLLHHDLEIVLRILRDQFTESFKAIWVDNEELYETVIHFVQRFQPSLVGRVKLYTRDVPIFDAFGVTQEIEKALRPKVWLKSGGYIVINQTEALVAVDVNTGKFVGKSNRLEDTIVKTNTEAVKEIVRQIRLRDLGGIIVVDFIDMDERKNRQKVMLALEEAMRADRAPYKILQFNDFGLVAITRKRVKQSLERALCSPCPTCEGASYVKSVPTVVGEILQEARKMRRAVEDKSVVLRAHPEVARYLKSNSNTYLEEIEEVLGRPVLVTSDVTIHPEKFSLA